MYKYIPKFQLQKVLTSFRTIMCTSKYQYQFLSSYNRHLCHYPTRTLTNTNTTLSLSIPIDRNLIVWLRKWYFVAKCICVGIKSLVR